MTFTIHKEAPKQVLVTMGHADKDVTPKEPEVKKDARQMGGEGLLPVRSDGTSADRDSGGLDGGNDRDQERTSQQARAGGRERKAAQGRKHEDSRQEKVGDVGGPDSP